MFKKNKKNNEETVAKGTVKIRVFMRFGAEIRQKRAEYMATEKRDNYNNLVVINEKFLHNEDVDFSQEEVYSGMNVTLGLEGIEKREATDKLKKEILRYEKRVKAIEKHPELNVLANIWDEKRKLRELNIFLRYLKHRSRNGAYFTIDNGVRVYDFESIDGFLIPIWHGADNLSDYPDFTRKKKITMQETANLVNYFDTKGGKQLMQNAFVLALIATVVMFCVCCFLGYKLYTMYGDKMDRCQIPAEDATNFCAQKMAETYGIFQQLMKESVIVEYIEDTNTTSKAQINNKIQDLMPK